MIKLNFPGTKGFIEEHTKKHKYHSSMILEHKNFKLMIDCGIKSKTLKKLAPKAIIITHAHPDHYIWTEKNLDTKIPVYASKKTFKYGKFRPKNCMEINPGKKFKAGPFTILPYKVIHSLICPAIGFKINVDKKIIIYNPDLVGIINKNKILKNVDYYIGDGSCIMANLVRKKEKKIFGHARVSTQINWCRKFGIKNIIFTHLGKETLKKEKKFKKKHDEIIFAYDGMKIKI